jgi:hypothetical protein
MSRASRNLLYIKYFLCFIVFTLPIGCTSTEMGQVTKTQDGGLFSIENTCKPPCFWDITPGISTEADVKRVLQAKSVLSSCESFDYESQGGVRGNSCSFGLGFSYHQGKDVVAGIGVKPSQQITVGEVVNAYGKPSAVLVTLVGTPDEKQQTSMILYFDQINTILILGDQDGYSFDIQPSTVINNIGYNDDAEYKSVRNYSSSWTGYGKYEEINH